VTGLCLDVPVVSMLSIKQFLDGQYIEDRSEYTLLRKFCLSCWEKNMFMNKDTFNGDQGSFGSNPIPYITSMGDWSDSTSILREKIHVPNEKRNTQDILPLVCKKLYEKNQRALKTSAFCKGSHTFMLCMRSLLNGFDMRGFFGGMSKYHDSKSLLQSLNLPFADKFDSNFLDSGSIEVDPVACVGRVEHEIFCLGLRIWDILLFFAIMKRPRRDVSLIEDVSCTLTEHMVSMLPLSIFPYEIVPANKVDSITNTQRVFDFGQNRVHGTIVRGKNLSIFSPNFKMDCKGSERSGVLEDEMYMTSLIMMSNDMQCSVQDFPIDKWPITLALSWGVCYPFYRYPNAKIWKDAEGPASDLARQLEYSNKLCVMMHPSRHSVMIFAMDQSSTLTLASTPILDLDKANWVPNVRMVAEFATAPLSDTTIVAPDMDAIQRTVFSLGFGPMPFYRRCSVAVEYLDELDDGDELVQIPRVSCIMPHTHGLNGCRHSAQPGGCYFCPYNPFYELLIHSTKTVVRCSPIHVSESVIPGQSQLRFSSENPSIYTY
jgi:hypothetical protein